MIKRNRKKKDHQKESKSAMVHISQLGSTTAVNATKMKDGELGQLLETLAIEAKTRSQNRHKELDETDKEQVKFLLKCRNLAQSVIPGPMEVPSTNCLKRHINYLRVWCQPYKYRCKIKRNNKKKRHLDYRCSSTQPS